MNLNLHDRYQAVELVVAANFTANQVNFPDIPELRSDSDKDALVFSIATYTSAGVPTSFSGNPVATLAQIQNAFLTLYILGAEQIFKIPLLDFLNIASLTSGYYYSQTLNQYEPLRIDWTKSYVQFATPPATNAQYVYLLKVGYGWYPPGTYATYQKNKLAGYQQGIIRT